MILVGLYDRITEKSDCLPTWKPLWVITPRQALRSYFGLDPGGDFRRRIQFAFVNHASQDVAPLTTLAS